MRARLVAALGCLVIFGSLGFASCGNYAGADSPPKSRTQIVADACHAAYAAMQHDSPVYYSKSHSYDSQNYVANYAYFVAFTADYCQPGR